MTLECGPLKIVAKYDLLIGTWWTAIWHSKKSNFAHYKPQARFSGDCDVRRRNLRIFLKGEAPSLLFRTKGYITSRDPEPILKLSTMFVWITHRFWATCRKVLDKNRLDLMASRLRFRQSNRKREIETRCHLSR